MVIHVGEDGNLYLMMELEMIPSIVSFITGILCGSATKVGRVLVEYLEQKTVSGV